MLERKIEQRKRELWRIKPVSEEEKERISRTLDDKKDIWYRGKNLRRADEIREVSDELQVSLNTYYLYRSLDTSSSSYMPNIILPFHREQESSFHKRRKMILSPSVIDQPM